jgi:hypothetical protein
MSQRPEPSHRFLEYSKPFGTPLQADDSVWERYLQPSIHASLADWQGLLGSKNGIGDAFDLEVGYVERKSLPNAICGYHQGLHMVLMYHTFPIMLLELFSRLLRNFNVLSDIGDAKAGMCEPIDRFSAPPGFAIVTGEVSIQHIDNIAEIFGPSCPTRRAAVLELFNSAMILIWQHEISHAVNGHVLYAREEMSVRDIDEQKFNTYQSRTSDDPIRSFMEAQADAGATFSHVLWPLLRRMRFPSFLSSDQVPALRQDIKLKILSMAFLSWYWMMLDVLQAQSDLNAIDTWTDHPSSLARALARVLMPAAQASHLALAEEAVWIVEHACADAATELLRVSDEWEVFRPFRWLSRPDMYSSVFAKHDHSDTKRRDFTARLSKYRYLHQP